jgi:hypothetical protein
VARRLIGIVLLGLLAGCGGSGDTPTTTAAIKAGPRPDFVGVYSDDAFFGDNAYRRRTFREEHAAGVRLG